MAYEQHAIKCEELVDESGRLWELTVRGTIHSWQEAHPYGSTYAYEPMSEIDGDLEFEDVKIYDDQLEDYVPFTGKLPDDVRAIAEREFEERT